MKHHTRLPSLAGLLALGLFALPACSLLPEAAPDLTHYHTLSLPPAVESANPDNKGSLNIALRKVDVSPYLAKGLLVVRTGDNEVLFDDYARWAEPLEAAIARNLQACLQNKPGIARVSIPPLRFDGARNYDLIIRVLRADGLRESGSATTRFVAVIEVHSAGAGSGLLAQRNFTAPPLAWDGKDYNSLANALSSSVQLLADEITSMLEATNKAQ